MERKGSYVVVNDSEVLQVFLENTQVFDQQAITGEAGVSVVPGLDELVIGVQVVQYRISVLLICSSEHDNLEELIGIP